MLGDDDTYTGDIQDTPLEEVTVTATPISPFPTWLLFTFIGAIIWYGFHLDTTRQKHRRKRRQFHHNLD